MDLTQYKLIGFFLSPFSWISILIGLWVVGKILKFVLKNRKNANGSSSVNPKTGALQDVVVVNRPKKKQKASTSPSSEAVKAPVAVSNLTPSVRPSAPLKANGGAYNLELASYLWDNHLKDFIEGNVRTIKPGDVLKNLIKGTDWEKPFDRALSSGGYQYPFQHSLEKELRTLFFLRTEASDNFEDLWARFKRSSEKFLSTQDILFLEGVVRKGNERMASSSYIYPMPMKAQGKVRKGTKADLKTLCLDLDSEAGKAIWDEYEKDFFVEERVDGPDLLALKELVNIFEGGDVHPLSIGPGFFCKYMKEFSELSSVKYKTNSTVPLKHSLIFKVIDGKVSGMKIGAIKEIDGLEGKMNGVHGGITVLRHVPTLLSASSLVFSELLDWELEKVVTSEKELVRPKYTFKGINENTQYFVVVDGCVAGPSTKAEVKNDGSKNASLNDIRIPAGECFKYSVEGDACLSTRLYFAPYDPNQVAPFLNHGGVIFGANDWSYHSTTTAGIYPEPINDFHADEYKAYMKERWDKGLPYEPADSAGRLHYFPKRADGSQSFETDMFMEENAVALASITDGVVEHNPYIVTMGVKWANVANPLVFPTPMSYAEILTAHDFPLSHRWSLAQYMKDGCGIIKNLQPTLYTNLRDVVEKNNLANLIKFNADCASKRAKGE